MRARSQHENKTEEKDKTDREKSMADVLIPPLFWGQIPLLRHLVVPTDVLQIQNALANDKFHEVRMLAGEVEFCYQLSPPRF